MIKSQPAPLHQYQKQTSRLKTFIACFIAASLLSIGGLFWFDHEDSQQTDMSTVLNQIRLGKVSTAKLIDAERRIEITTIDKKHFHSYWGEGGDQGSELADELQKAKLPNGYTVEVPLRRW